VWRRSVTAAVLVGVAFGAVAIVAAFDHARPERPFTDAIRAGAPIDRNSPAMVRRLVSAARDGFFISAQRWTTPVYYVAHGTRRQTVRLTAEWAPRRRLLGVPIPADASPDPSPDAHLTIVDPQRRCEYDFWRARKRRDGSWSAEWANATASDGNGVYPGGWGATAAGFTNLAGKIWPQELAAGEIRHALVFGFPYTKSGGPVRPATSSDGESTAPAAIPEGARLQLDPALDLDSLGLSDWQKVVARALQVYGMYLGDTGDAVGLSAVDPRSFPGTAYPWGDAEAAALPTSLLEHMRVLRLPRQQRPRAKLVASKCARFA
jgi:hypothetical protein